MLDTVIQHLAASGPMALVMGVAVVQLWKANKEERDRHAKQEDDLRAAHENERRALNSQLFDVVMKLTRAMRKESSGESS